MTGLVSNRGNQVGLVTLGEAGSKTRGEIVDSSIHSPLQSKFSSLFSGHRGVAMGRGRGRKREGGKCYTGV